MLIIVLHIIALKEDRPVRYTRFLCVNYYTIGYKYTRQFLYREIRIYKLNK